MRQCCDAVSLTNPYENERIVPVANKVLPLAETRAALDYSKSGRAKGKIVL